MGPNSTKSGPTSTEVGPVSAKRGPDSSKTGTRETNFGPTSAKFGQLTLGIDRNCLNSVKIDPIPAKFGRNSISLASI